MYYQTQEYPETIDFSALCQQFPERYPATLISTASNEQQGRYDILFAYPQQTLKLSFNHTLTIDNKVTSGGFLDVLDKLWNQEKVKHSNTPAPLPFTGGWFVFLSYELAGEIEPTLKLSKTNTTLPIATAMRCPAAVIFDHKTQQSHIVVENEHTQLFELITNDIKQAQQFATSITKINTTHKFESDEKPYLQQLNRIKEYIKEGDIFQANLSRLWQLDIKDTTEANLFKQLAKNNPGSFAALAFIENQSIISSSPERLVSVRNNTIQTRPIAGTRPRTEQAQSDEDLSKELLSHPKEKAEHIMLIDLERNDLGRLCEPGSIKVNELMILESYQHVHHIVSNVKGTIRPKITPCDVIRAVFPGGTITGCPKVRCMQILTEMEQEARGAYTGSLGYINRDGSMDLNILIRTMVKQDNQISFRAGGGIVADSDPLSELEETRAKAKGLLKVFD